MATTTSDRKQNLIGLKLITNLPKPNGLGLAVTPCLDLLFHLFLFFMLTNNVVFQPGIQISPPVVEDAVEQYADKLVIMISEDNRLYFNDQEMADTTELTSELESINFNLSRHNLAQNPDKARRPVIILKADKSASYAEVAKISAIASKNGSKVLWVTSSR